jgi:LysM repeat protein
MRQAKRLFYIVLLNIIISAITVIMILRLWESEHPSILVESTPIVIVVTPTQSVILPLVANNSPSGALDPITTTSSITQTLQATPTLAMLTYQIKEGDTLGALAVEFNVGVLDILAVNDLTDPDNLYVGQIINIPTAPLPKATFTSIPPTVIASPTLRPSSTATIGPITSSTPTPIGQPAQVIINAVIGAGVLENERIVLRRTGDGEIAMAGWRLEDGTGNIYMFPQLTLYKDGAINLNTRSGQNTVVDLFWNLTTAIWRSGKTISLYDSQNNLRATYTVP